MTNLYCPYGAALILIVGVVSISGCESSTSESEWTVQTDALERTEPIRLGKDGDFYFGEIYDIAVDEEGQIYVADGQAGHVKVITPNGTPQDTIGRPGDGPGEFQRPFRLGLTKTDSLYVMDSRRVAVFGPGREFQYRFRTQGAAGAPRNMMVPSAGGGAFFAYLPFPDEVAKTGARAVVRHVGSNGEVGDTLLAVRSRQAGPNGRPLPFSRLSVFDLGPDGTLHHAWSDSLRVTSYSRTGERQDRIEIPFDPVPISPDEQRTALGDRSEEERAALREHMPDTKPAFDHFLVDDEGRYWFGRPTSTPDSTAWWVARPGEHLVRTATLPSETQIMTVRDDKAYGRTTTDTGAPVLIQYTINFAR